MGNKLERTSSLEEKKMDREEKERRGEDRRGGEAEQIQPIRVTFCLQ